MDRAVGRSGGVVMMMVIIKTATGVQEPGFNHSGVVFPDASTTPQFCLNFSHTLYYFSTFLLFLPLKIDMEGAHSGLPVLIVHEEI
jgi:hypothetical protein